MNLKTLFLKFLDGKPSLKSLELFTDLLQPIDADSRKTYIFGDFNINIKNILIMIIALFARNKYLPMLEAVIGFQARRSLGAMGACPPPPFPPSPNNVSSCIKKVGFA